MPLRDGEWTPAALAQARIVARMRHARPRPRPAARARPRRAGSPTATSRTCSRRREAEYDLADAARETGLEPELIRRIWSAAGFSAGVAGAPLRRRHRAAAAARRGARRRAAARRLPAARARLRAGAGADRRRRGQALPPLRPRADDPRRRARCWTSPRSSRTSRPSCCRWPGRSWTRSTSGCCSTSSSRTSSGTSSSVADDAALGRVRVAIAFADLAGYTRLTEEVGEEEALEVVERFVELVAETLPDDARVIKTIGDEVMVVGTDAVGARRLGGRLPELVDRAAAAADRHPRRQRALPRRRLLRPRGQPRGARRGAGDRRRGAGHARGQGGGRAATSTFQPIGEVKLKGFDEATELFLAGPR